MNVKQTAVIKYVLAAIIIFVCSFATVLGVTPFGCGVYMGFCFAGFNPLILAPVLICSAAACSFSWQTLLGSGVVCVVFCLLWLVKKFKKFPDYIYYIVSPFSLAGFIPLFKSPAPVVLFIFFAPITLYVSGVFLSPLIKRGLRFKLLDYELICGGILLSIFALGLNRLDIYYFPVVAVIAAFIILFCGKMYGITGALIAGLCFGAGGAVFDYQIIWFAYYPVMALLCGIFLPAPRIISAIGSLIGYILITYFFNIPAPHAYLWLIAILVGGLGYVLIPKKYLNGLKNILNPAYAPTGARYNINLLREDSARSIYKTGEVFSEMSVFIGGGEDKSYSDSAFANKLRGGICANCNKNGKNCNVTNEDLEKLCAVSVEKGRATIIDLPKNMIDDCKYNPSMISATGKMAEELFKKNQQLSGEKMAKGIVSEQLAGISEVLKLMSNKLSTPVGYEFETENKIKEELTYRGIYCYDCIVSPNAVTLVVAPEHYSRPQIERVLKKVLKSCYLVQREENSSIGMIAYCSLMPQFDVVFAQAGLAKGEVSGDTHSFIKINGNKFLMALCDGMGSGDAARKFSNSTVSLIECFYKAGFDHGMVIKSVNRFLSLSSDESFAASDICVLDLSSGICDIFKIGSPACFIKGNDTVRAIEGSSLPMGVLDDIRPSFSELALNNGDMVILVSDGVSDCFEGDALIGEISCASDVSPELLCKHILTAAKAKSSKVRDDMTVAALRLFLNV